MLVRIVVIAGAALTLACSQKDSSSERLPAAKTWGQTSTGPATETAGSARGMGTDPHAGVDMGTDPHAGVDMGDPSMAGLEPPDPNRKIDASKFLRGRISVAPAFAGRVKTGAILFLSVRPVDKNTGTVLGQPLAVDRIDVTAMPVSFDLGEKNTMVAGTSFTGDVQIYARIDGDGEAKSGQPGDIEGDVMATIPQKGIQLLLDRELK